MSRLASVFSGLRDRGEKALVLFVTAGDPSLAQLPSVLDALAEGGADVIEVGVPFSDPIADGPTIQASSQRALDRGATFSGVLDAVRGFDRVPVVFMGYYNTFFRRGLQASLDAMKGAGVCGSIVSDLIPEEADEWRRLSHGAGLDTVFLAAPTSTDERLAMVSRASTGFVYAVSRTGVTGAGSEVPPEVSSLVNKIRANTDLPVCVGFGISKPEHVKMVCSVADGAVIGSWLVDWLDKNWDNGAGRDELIAKIKGLKAVTRL